LLDAETVALYAVPAVPFARDVLVQVGAVAGALIVMLYVADAFGDTPLDAVTTTALDVPVPVLIQK
jgi:hypothetical protein